MRLRAFHVNDLFDGICLFNYNSKKPSPSNTSKQSLNFEIGTRKP